MTDDFARHAPVLFALETSLANTVRQTLPFFRIAYHAPDQHRGFIVKYSYFTLAGVVIDRINDDGISGAEARRYASFFHHCQTNQDPVNISTTF